MKRKVTTYLIQLSIILLLFWSVNKWQYNNVSNIHQSTYHYLIIQFIIFCIGGTAFGIDKLFNEIRTKGSWRIDLPKLIIFGLPSLFLSIYSILLLRFTFIPMVSSNLFEFLFQLFLGYIIVTSFYKTK